FLWLLTTACGRRERGQLEAPRISLEPPELLADGYDLALLEVQGTDRKPKISVLDQDRGVRIQDPTGERGLWRAEIRSGVAPGSVRLQIDAPGRAPALATVNLILDTRDQSEDGTPDFLRLDTQADREAFRRWFTFFAESQYFQLIDERPAEI